MKRVLIYLLLVLTLVNCTTKPTKDKDSFDFANHVLNPIILLTASTCIRHYENNSWPQFEKNTGDNSLFEYYSVKEISENTSQVSFKLKYFNPHWELKLARNTGSSSMKCEGELSTVFSASSEPFTLPILVDSTEINSLLTNDYTSVDPVSNFFIKIIFASLIEKPDSDVNSKFKETLIVLGGYITTASLCVLLAMGGASCL